MTNHVGISLGWNCNAAIEGVRLNIRKTKKEGYLTCPFDAMVANLEGVIKCLEEDFENFCKSIYLDFVTRPQNVTHLSHLKENEKLLRNNYYGFLFNHESPGHSDLYITQNWKGGINHYVDNDYFEFKQRYNRRIDNFRNYLKGQNEITFIIHRYRTDETDRNIIKLNDVLKRRCG